MDELIVELIGACRALRKIERTAVCCGTVTVPQCLALQTLLEGHHDVGTLAERLASSASAVTRLVDGLARRGWVERVRTEGDRRRVVLTLTALGRTEANRLKRATEQGVSTLLRAAALPDRAVVVAGLKAIRGQLELGQGQLVCCPPSPGATVRRERGGHR